MALPRPLVPPRSEKLYHTIVPIIASLPQTVLGRISANVNFSCITLEDIGYILSLLQDAYQQGPRDHPCPFCLDLHCPERVKLYCGYSNNLLFEESSNCRTEALVSLSVSKLCANY